MSAAQPVTATVAAPPNNSPHGIPGVPVAALITLPRRGVTDPISALVASSAVVFVVESD